LHINRYDFGTKISTIKIQNCHFYVLASTEYGRPKIQFLVPASNELGRPKFLLASNSIRWDEIPIPFSKVEIFRKSRKICKANLFDFIEKKVFL